MKITPNNQLDEGLLVALFILAVALFLLWSLKMYALHKIWSMPEKYSTLEKRITPKQLIEYLAFRITIYLVIESVRWLWNKIILIFKSKKHECI